MSKKFSFTISITIPDLVTGTQKSFFIQNFSEEQCVQYFSKPTGRIPHQEILLDFSQTPILGRFLRIQFSSSQTNPLESLSAVEIYPLFYQSKYPLKTTFIDYLDEAVTKNVIDSYL